MLYRLSLYANPFIGGDKLGCLDRRVLRLEAISGPVVNDHKCQGHFNREAVVK